MENQHPWECAYEWNLSGLATRHQAEHAANRRDLKNMVYHQYHHFYYYCIYNSNNKTGYLPTCGIRGFENYILRIPKKHKCSTMLNLKEKKKIFFFLTISTPYYSNKIKVIILKKNIFFMVLLNQTKNKIDGHGFTSLTGQKHSGFPFTWER